MDQILAAKQAIINDYENLNYASVIRQITSLADAANRYVEQNKPWDTIKTDAEKTRTTLTAIINAVKILSVYLKPVLPVFAEKIEKILNIAPLSFADIDKAMENHKINKYIRLAERVDKDKVQAMVEESKNQQSEQKPPTLDEPLAPQCTIEDFMKVDLRVAKIVKAEKVAGADKLLHLDLDMGGTAKSVFAGIAQAYQPQQLSRQTGYLCCEPAASQDEVRHVRRDDSRCRLRRKGYFHSQHRPRRKTRPESTLTFKITSCLCAFVAIYEKKH